MAHIEEGILQAYLDDEVGARAQIDSHLAHCATCVAELERLRSAAQLFASALRAEDQAAPILAAHAALKRAQRAGAPPPRRLLPRIPLARAAMLLVGLAAVASATIPGSPVREWITDKLGSADQAGQVRPDAPGQPEATPAPALDEERSTAAISVEPASGRVAVYLSGAASDAQVNVRRVDAGRASVQVLGGAASVRFRTGPGRIEVLGVGSSEVTVEIPRAAEEARVEVDGRLIFQNRR